MQARELPGVAGRGLGAQRRAALAGGALPFCMVGVDRTPARRAALGRA
jgi:hypothetical protein